MTEYLQTIADGPFPGWCVAAAALFACGGIGSLALRRAPFAAQCALGFCLASLSLCGLFLLDDLRHLGAAAAALHVCGMVGLLIRKECVPSGETSLGFKAWILLALHCAAPFLHLAFRVGSDPSALDAKTMLFGAAAFIPAGALAARPGISWLLRGSCALFLTGLACGFFFRRIGLSGGVFASELGCAAGMLGLFAHAASASFSDFFLRNRIAFLVLLPILAVLSIGCFQYPAAWDECVYQLAIPRHWILEGSIQFRRDIPYGGFPLLPQFFFVPLTSCGGFAAVKSFLFLASCGFFFALTALFGGAKWKCAGIVFSVSFLICPLSLSLFVGGYVEPLSAFLFAGALLLANGKEEGFVRYAALGVLAGGMTAFKLNGAFPAACLFLYLVLKERRRFDAKKAAVFLVAAFAAAAPFYLRVLLETGSAVYPYFGSAKGEASVYHHALGTEKFDHGFWWLFLLPFALSLHGLRRLFDGSFGLSLLAWFGAALFFLSRKKTRAASLAGAIPLAFYALSWFFSSPQARFLLPSLPLLALTIRPGSGWLSKKGRVFLAAAAIASLCSIPAETPRSFISNWAILFRGAEGKLAALNGRIGNDHLALCDVLRRGAGGTGKTLLIGEERTLYLPESCVVGTPFFQEAWFADGRIPDADAFRRRLVEEGFSSVYFRFPEGNPDLLPHYAIRWLEPVMSRLKELCETGGAEIVFTFGKSALYRLTPLEKSVGTE